MVEVLFLSCETLFKWTLMTLLFCSIHLLHGIFYALNATTRTCPERSFNCKYKKSIRETYLTIFTILLFIIWYPCFLILPLSIKN